MCRLKKWVRYTIMKTSPLCRRQWRYYDDADEVVNIIPDLSICGYSSNPIPTINNFPWKIPRKWIDWKITQKHPTLKEKTQKKSLKIPQALQRKWAPSTKKWWKKMPNGWQGREMYNPATTPKYKYTRSLP